MAFEGVPDLMVQTILALLLLSGIGWWWTGPSSDELAPVDNYLSQTIMQVMQIMDMKAWAVLS